jgi:hypothetical protein
MTAETLSFARRLGLDPAEIVDLLQSNPLGAPYAVQKARTMLAGDFRPAFALKPSGQPNSSRRTAAGSVVGEGHRCPADDEDVGDHTSAHQSLAKVSKRSFELRPVE